MTRDVCESAFLFCGLVKREVVVSSVFCGYKMLVCVYCRFSKAFSSLMN